MTLTPTHIIQYLYCPRFTYFEYVLRIPQYEEKDFKVMKGREIHEQKLAKNKEYLRKKIGVKAKHQDQYLANDKLRGVVDEVLELHDGTMAPLDYKFAEFKNRVFTTYLTQLYCYSWLIEENFQKQVLKGFIVYVRSKNKLVELPVSSADKDLVQQGADGVLEIIETNCYPKATKYKSRCLSCTYSNICIK